jgi:hypothetical protein
MNSALVGTRVARFFLTQNTKKGKSMPNYQIYLNIPNGRNIFPKAIEYMYQPFPFQGPPKFILIGIFGLKKHHLATLVGTGQLFTQGFQNFWLNVFSKRIILCV